MKKYEEYKSSEIEWLGNIPVDWSVKKIKWMTSIRRGASPRPIDDPKYFDENGEYAWVRIADVSSAGMYLEQTTQKMSELGASLSVKREPGDIFVSIAGTVGKPCITNIKCCIHDGFVYFPDYKGDKKYLYYIFESGAPYKGLGKMGTQLNLNTETIGSIKIPNIALSLQRKIAFFLDRKVNEIDALLNLKQKQIDTLEQQRQSIITEAVTKGLNPNVTMKESGVEWIGEIPEHWEIKKIKHVATIKGRIGFRGYTVGDIVSEGQGAITLSPSNIQDGKLNLDKRTYLSWEKYYESPEIMVAQNDVIFCKTGSSYGKATLIKKIDYPMTLNPQLILIRVNKANPAYVSYVFQSSLVKDQVETIVAGGTMPTISQENLLAMTFIEPSKREQDEIVSYLNEYNLKIDNLVESISKQIQKLKEYRQSLIYEAVTGKIDVREMELD